ncbi:MAG: hypothetical protein J6Q87_06135 [Clostridia bacterium]|nr:hypothetical protein [Clostridia bacterium]
MIRKIICISFVFIFLCGCSQEQKFGVEQFVSRINNQYGTTYKTADFVLGTDKDNKNYLFYDNYDGFITLSLDSKNNITGVSLLFNESMDTNKAINTFCNICCVFTGYDKETILHTFSDIKITTETIKFADNNTVVTVGKYKYTIVCNEYSITLFCDRV